LSGQGAALCYPDLARAYIAASITDAAATPSRKGSDIWEDPAALHFLQNGAHAPSTGTALRTRVAKRMQY
jgi:hypothetical protein